MARAKRGNPNWIKGGPSPNPSGKAKARRDAAARMDGWRSALGGMGYAATDKAVNVSFIADIIDAETAATLWRGDDLAARIVETVPSEMLRRAFSLRVQTERPELQGKPGSYSEGKPGGDAEDPAQKIGKGAAKPPRARRDLADAETDEGADKDIQESISARWDELGLIPALWDALCYERAYGGGAILLGAQDGSTDLAKPLNEERVRSLDWITALEPRELQPLYYYSDPRAPKFGQVAVYQLNPLMPGTPAPGEKIGQPNVAVHESRLIIFPGTRVSRLQLGPDGWGDSIFSRVYRVLRDFGTGWGSAAILLNDFSQAVFKMAGLAEMIALDKDADVMARMRAVELSRSTARAVLIDKDGEEFERKQTPVSGLPELLDRFAQRLAAAADMPLTLLMGISPGGLNATGESDIRFFYDRVAAMQQRKLVPAIEKITRLLMRVEGADEPDDWCIEFPPLWQPTDLERATARKAQADTDAVYITAGVLSPEEVAVSRFGGDEYSYETNVDFAARSVLDRQMEREAKEQADLEIRMTQASKGMPPGGDAPPEAE